MARVTSIATASLLAMLAPLEICAAPPSPSRFPFMDKLDAHDPWGVIVPTANAVSANASFTPPPLDYAGGCAVIAVFPSLTDQGAFEVYAENTTGWEPLTHNNNTGAGQNSKPRPYGPTSLLRFTTRDFRGYSAPRRALMLRFPEHTPSMKSIARDDAAGRYVLVVVSHGFHTFESTDAGSSWTELNTTGVAGDDKDDLNLIYNGGRFVDMQIVWQKLSTPLKYCDNGGCDQRRIISAKTSSAGAEWSKDLGYRPPDAGIDPPLLQFYRMRPFYVAGGNGGADDPTGGRLAAHVLQYAPAPPQSVVTTKYGRAPPMCQDSSGKYCHAPHLYEEWWLGPTSNDASDVAGWRRPFRLTHAAPHDAFLMAQPVAHEGQLLWVGSTGDVYTLPSGRIAGLYAPANGEISSPAFAMPPGATPAASRLTLNAAAAWRGALVTGGCDEGCNAYVFCELQDAETGAVVPGFERTAFDTLMGVDGSALALTWGRGANGAVGSGGGGVNGGRPVRLRIGFRDATIYALDIQQQQQEGAQ